MMEGPTGQLVRPATDRKPAKYEKTVETGARQLDVWYTDSPGDDGFGAIVEARALALAMVEKTVAALKSPDRLACEALKTHFGKLDTERDKGELTLLRERFEQIRDGLSKPLVICLARSSTMKGRGLTTRKGRIHLNLSILGNVRLAIARTIVHEASHAFARIPGSGVDGYGDAFDEYYAKSKAYARQTASAAINCADSYAWTALSIYEGHVTQPATYRTLGVGFSNHTGCQQCLQED